MQGHVIVVPLHYPQITTHKTIDCLSSFVSTDSIEMIKRIVHLLICLLFLLPTFAATQESKEGRKQMKSIKEQLKAKKANEALAAVEKLRADSAYTWNPQLLQYGVEAHKMLNNKENEKFYLKAKADTAALFNTTYNVVSYILLTDSAERMLSGGEKFRFRKSNRETLRHLYRNVQAAPVYFSAHGKWDETQRFSALAIDLALSEIVGSLRHHKVDKQRVREMAVVNVNACYRQHNYKDIERYAHIALQDSANEESVFEKLAFSEVERGDSALYHKRLYDGHERFPSNMFFFSRLTDINLRHGDNDAVLEASNKTLEYVLTQAQNEAYFCVIDTLGNYEQPTDAQALSGVRTSVVLPSEQIAQIFEARAIAHHNRGDARLCIEDAENILSWNPEHPRANFYIGASYYALAENIQIPANVTDQNYQKATRERNRLLTLALPKLETYRQSSPEDSDNWAPLLYEVYLYLNMGPEFEEISHFLK